MVLNLIINGLPSIPELDIYLFDNCTELCFKPYYKWITFNTSITTYSASLYSSVLNLIINGLPSILWKNVC